MRITKLICYQPLLELEHIYVSLMNSTKEQKSDTLISLFLAASRSAAFTSRLPIPCNINYHQPLIFRKNFCMIKEHKHISFGGSKGTLHCVDYC
ncbi:hypothetical protein VIGAN_04323700 [Vigna angularis var. angularis]|uniref:Uncharacterized protein n=1 Tax=Vigna angularis var. angularis TaxID=157739 RepID=A0A0S3RYR4_PHAAN|nr:hypothetical protein VIGAN_04323700 [Vigna angularis var. angularis]